MLRRLASTTFTQTRKMHVESIPMRWGRGDNYAYLVSDDATNKAVIIDPAEPADVLPAMDKQITERKLKLVNIINTHHHHDHAGGNERVSKQYPVPIIGGKDCPLVSSVPADGSTFTIGENIEVTAIQTPCHTLDSTCYYFHDKSKDQRAVFTGDTLFIAGCGRFFEGTAEGMYKGLNKLSKLPGDTKVYPGHEYTKANVKFVKTVLNNEHVQKLDQFASTNEHTTGRFTIADEANFNPFMQTHTEAMQQKTGVKDPIEVMAKLREMKNSM